MSDFRRNQMKGQVMDGNSGLLFDFAVWPLSGRAGLHELANHRMDSSAPAMFA